MHLTRPTIARFTPALRRSPSVELYDTSGWATARIQTDPDADPLMTLVSLALHAHTARWPPPAPEPCNWHHPERQRASDTRPQSASPPRLAGQGLDAEACSRVDGP